MGNILLGVPNSSYIILSDNSGYGYKSGEEQNRAEIRTKDGKLFTYISPASTYRKIEIPMKFVNSSDVSLINSYWSTATDLRYIEDDSFPNSFYNVRIVGKTEPFVKFVEPYFRQLYEGKVVLETI